ncbi:MAG: DUF2092 domain-containing protein [Pseudomonadota bacterium]
MSRPNHLIARRALLGLAAAGMVMPMAPALAETEAPTPEALIRAMAQRIAGAQTISVEIDEYSDITGPNEQKILRASNARLQLIRPDRIHLDARFDRGRLEIVYTGTDLVVVKHAAASYGTFPVSGTVGAAMAAIAERFGTVMPVAEVFAEDLEARLEAGVVAVRDLGAVRLAETPARHLLLLGESRNVQLWIAEEGAMLLRLAVTDLATPKQPQRLFVFSDWQLDVALSPEALEITIPDEYRHGEVALPSRD